MEFTDFRRFVHSSETDQRVLTCALQNMRMSCNSTYLLDHETDHGTKVDELAALLGELFERPEAVDSHRPTFSE